MNLKKFAVRMFLAGSAATLCGCAVSRTATLPQQYGVEVAAPIYWSAPGDGAMELREWIGPRISGAAPHTLVLTAEAAVLLPEFDIRPTTVKISGLTNGEQAWKFSTPLEVAEAPAPDFATPLLYDDQYRPVVWRMPLADGQMIVFCGLPAAPPENWPQADRKALQGAVADFFAMTGLPSPLQSQR